VQRTAFRLAVAPLDVARFLFIDEMGIHCGLTRLFARAFRGERAVCSAPRATGANISVIGALGLRGLVASMSLEGAIDGLALRAFLEQLLVPELQPGDLVFMDNLPVHRSAWVRPTIEACGAHLMYLPAYSPDFSPIENCWSKVKEWLRKVAARTGEALEQALTQALALITREDIRAWFNHCGYPATPK
jgi:transposase